MRLDEELQGIGSVGIAGHIRPDGDCVGSCLSVYNYITTYFPQIDVDVIWSRFRQFFISCRGLMRLRKPMR